MSSCSLRRPNPLPIADRLALTKAEAAKAVGVSTRYLELEAAAGRLKFAKAGRKVLIRTQDLSAWLESRLTSAD